MAGLPDPHEEEPARTAAAYALMALAWGFGWRIAAGVLLGYWVDEYLGTSPWCMLGFALGALVGSVRQMLALARRDAAGE